MKPIGMVIFLNSWLGLQVLAQSVPMLPFNPEVDVTSDQATAFANPSLVFGEWSNPNHEELVTSNNAAGWAFFVSARATVTHLGYYDDGLDGLTRNHSIAIWNYDTGDVVSEALIPKGTAPELNGAYRWTNVPETVLSTGSYVVGERYIETQPGDGEQDRAKGVRALNTLVPTDPQIAYTVSTCAGAVGDKRAPCLLYDTAVVGPMVFVTPRGIRGDFNRTGDLDSHDIMLLTLAMRGLPLPLMVDGRVLDVNRDGVVDSVDRDIWVHDLLKSYFGDANADGEFNGSDLVLVFEAGEYEDGVDQNSFWRSGDWNSDGEFDSGDLVFAFQDGGYEKGPRPAAVPESRSNLILSLCALGVLHGRRISR